MGNRINLGLIGLILVVLGCSCPNRLTEMANTSSQPERPANIVNSTREATPAPSSRGEYEVTKAKYDQIKVGMKRSDVEKIMGGRGVEFYNGRGGGSSFISVKWEGEKLRTVFVNFKDDRVTSKNASSLD